MKDKKEEKEKLERQIVASLLIDYDGLIDSLRVPIDDFKLEHKEILTAMKESWTADVVALASMCPHVSMDEIWDITTAVFTANQNDFDVFNDELIEINTREKMESKLRQIFIMIQWWTPLNQIYSELNWIKIEWENETNLWDVLYELLQEVSWEKQVKIVPTWYVELDKLIWGYEEGQIVVIWARPWVWKSMFAINLINNNILAWEKVALFSLEMDAKQVSRRLLAMNSWVWVWKLKHKAEWEMLNAVQKWFNKLSEQLENLKIFDNVHTIWELERKIRWLVHKHWTSVVYLDYLQLLRNPSVKNNPIEALTDMSQRLKQLALELKITIVELSQLNRESDRTIVKRASQLRGSWSIEQDADMIWILDKEDEQSDKITVSVQKCRDGRIWDISLHQISDIMRITNLPPKPF